MEPVFFPYDVRRDITFYGLKITKIWIPIAGLIGAALLLLLDIPFIPILMKLLLLLLIPAALFVFFVFDVGQWVKRIRSFINEPPLRLPDSRGHEKSIQSLVKAKARPGGGPFLDYPDRCVGVVMSVQPFPREVMPEDEKSLEITAFKAALTRVLGNNVKVSIYTDFDLELPRVELEKKALEWRTRFPKGSRLRELAEARLSKFREENARTVKPVSHIRLLWQPGNRDFPRKPKDEKERDSLIAAAYSVIIETFAGNLEAGGINCRILGAEAARDIVSRQLNPADWRRVAPISNTCWESRLASQRKESQEDISPDEAVTLPGAITNTNLAVVVTFEKGTETKPVTLAIIEKLINAGYSVSLIDADIHSPGSMSNELGISDYIDWRQLPGPASPQKGLTYWGLSNDVFSVELSRPALLKVIEEAQKWSHVQIVHLGSNESSLSHLGNDRVIVVAGQGQPDIKTPLKFSKTGAVLVTEEENVKQATHKYRVRKCFALYRDIEFLAEFASGRSQ